MTVEELLEELDEMVDRSWSLPLSGGRTVMDAERIREILDDIRANLPQELRQARAIVADRAQIIGDAKREAETIVRVAEERSKALVNRDEIVQQAQARANDLIAQEQTRAREMRKATNDYVEDLMRRTDEALTANLAELRKTRQNIKASLRSGTGPAPGSGNNSRQNFLFYLMIPKRHTTSCGVSFFCHYCPRVAEFVRRLGDIIHTLDLLFPGG